ncbi:MAG: hypothetical protein M3R38_09235 [Actinomycetota bacterium]|nr:hypothetical protein [Actinomycetota bacterium]
MDTKILAVFAAATAAIGFTSRLPKTNDPLMPLVDASFYLAAAAWVAMVFVTLVHLRPRSHRRAVRADVLWTCKYRKETADKLKRRAVVDIRDAYRDNKEVLEGKANTLRWAAFFTAVEGVFIVLALTLVRASG